MRRQAGSDVGSLGFQLRRGIHYSDGELVRPEDFRRALERDLILGPNSNYGDLFADVIGGAVCEAHPSHCDFSEAWLPMMPRTR